MKKLLAYNTKDDLMSKNVFILHKLLYANQFYLIYPFLIVIRNYYLNLIGFPSIKLIKQKNLKK